MTEEGQVDVISTETLRYELEGRFHTAEAELGKYHLSVRWEPTPRVARVGAMLDGYDWDRRLSALRILRAFEREHADDFALEYDILPLEAVTSEEFAEA